MIGMCDAALQAIYQYQSVVLAKLLYASSAWWGFITTTDRQRVNGFLRRSKRSRFCPPDLSSFEELCEAADKKLFDKITQNERHLLHCQLPPPSIAAQNYIFDLEPTIDNYLNILAISQTQTSSIAIYIKIFTSCVHDKIRRCIRSMYEIAEYQFKLNRYVMCRPIVDCWVRPRR